MYLRNCCRLYKKSFSSRVSAVATYRSYILRFLSQKKKKNHSNHKTSTWQLSYEVCRAVPLHPGSEGCQALNNYTVIFDLCMVMQAIHPTIVLRRMTLCSKGKYFCNFVYTIQQIQQIQFVRYRYSLFSHTCVYYDLV